jgi:hypothetical protein
MKLPLRRKGSKTPYGKLLFPFLFIVYGVSAFVYILLLHYLRPPNPLPLVASLGSTSYGISIGGISIGYLTIALLLSLAAASVWAWSRGSTLSMAGVSAAVFVGLLLAAVFTAVSTVSSPPAWKYSVQDSLQGFTLEVYYNTTILYLGQNLTLKYVLADNSYSLTTPYNLFGGQFSMVFYNSTGGQVVAFRSPITFEVSGSQEYVQLAPGERWITSLGWNGTIFGANDTRSIALPGTYTLASYVALQDANVSLYAVLHPENISVSILR